MNNWGEAPEVKSVLAVRAHRTERVFRASMAMFAVMIPFAVQAQVARMAIEGSVQLDGAAVPPGTVIRILRQNGSVARTVSPYSTNPSQFGVRLSTTDGFREGEPLGFRVVVSRRDSFESRIAGPAPVFRGASTPELSVYRFLLFRNHLPSIRRQFPDTLINEYQLFRLRVSAIDVDSDTLRYRLIAAPPGAFVESLTGYVTWVPTYEQSGSHQFIVGVSDGLEESQSRRATIRVRHVNRAPRITGPLQSVTGAEGESIVIIVEALDDDKDSLQYSLIEKGYKTRLFSRNGVFEWKPDYEAAGLYHFVTIVSDGEFTDTSNVFTVSVANTNRLPHFDRSLVDTIAIEGERISVGMTAADPDGDTVQYGLELAPEGVSVDSVGQLVWTPTFDQAGSYVVVVSASDQQSSSESVVRINVLNRNRRPVFVHTGGKGGRETLRIPDGRLIELTWPTAIDPDLDDTLRYAIRLTGVGVDTSIFGIMDTSLSLLGRNRLQTDVVYTWSVIATDGAVEVACPDTFAFRLAAQPATAVRDPLPIVPRSFSLEHSSPNPQSSITSIRFNLAERSDVNLAIYNMLGERIQTIISGERDAGQYETTFDASSLSSGVYMFKLEAHPLQGGRLRDFVSTKKMVLVK